MNPLSFATNFRPLQSVRLALSTALLLSVALLSGCQDAATPQQESAASADQTANIDKAESAQVVSESPHAQPSDAADKGAKSDHETHPGTLDKPYEVNWSEVVNGTKPIDRDKFDYPFAVDSPQVTSYMSFFDVDAQTAQHNLTVGMASNEALVRVLDQLGTRYVSHELTDGENLRMIVHTTPEIAPSQHDYVFAEDFARGLTLPIVIKPDGVKAELK